MNSNLVLGEYWKKILETEKKDKHFKMLAEKANDVQTLLGMQ